MTNAPDTDIRIDGEPIQHKLAFLITDIRGSTPMWEQRPAAMRRATLAHDRILRAAVEARGGRVFKMVGDSVFAAFERAPDAIDAALAAMRALRVHDARQSADEVPLADRVRFGLHVGSAYAYGGDYLGLSVCLAKRIAEAGHGGQLLLSQQAGNAMREPQARGCRLHGLGRYRMKGVATPQAIVQVVTKDLPWVRRPPTARAARGEGWRKLARQVASMFL